MVPDLDERLAAIAEARAAGRDNLAGKMAVRLVERLAEAGVSDAPDAAEVARLRSAAELFGRAIDLLRAALEGPLRDLLRPGYSLIEDGIPALVAEVRRLRALEGRDHA
jgi:hypothetical protein